MSNADLFRWSFCLMIAGPVAAGAQTAPAKAASTTATAPTQAKAPGRVAPPSAAAKTKAPAATVAPKTGAAAVSASRQALQSQAKGLALATEVTETINASQLEISDRVLTGTARCELSQTVDVERLDDKPGHFRVRFNRGSYLMTPEETSTGAVRLVDRQLQVVWLQIPAKSMMMDQAAGRRMVDSCQHAEQRIAVDAAAAAGQSSLLNR
jgi:hypothetical protein